MTEEASRKRKFTFPADDEQLLRACSSRPRNRDYFEDLTNRLPWKASHWLEYVRFEESNNNLTGARSVYERGLKVLRESPRFWLSYASFELKHGFVNQARVLFQRALDGLCSNLHEYSSIWLSYVSLEEAAGADVSVLRKIFESWVARKWNYPESWGHYAEFELRYSGIDKAREIFERCLQKQPRRRCTSSFWVRYAKFEIENGDVSSVRECFDRALLAEDANRSDIELFLLYKEFEIRHKPPAWKKQRSLMYDEELEIDPLDYGVWFYYTQMMEWIGDKEEIRQVYRRALANTPASPYKPLWKDYIHLWINYALFEELEAQDIDQAREVYRECLAVIPHDKFSFAKCWVLAAKFEIRQLKVNDARNILDSALEKAPKHKLFREYIKLERKLGEVDHCRKLYAKYLEWAPEDDRVWLHFAKMEASRGEVERARAIFEQGIIQLGLASRKRLWNAYIFKEESEGNFEAARALYRRELEKRKQNVSTWIKYARFETRVAESSTGSEDDSAHRSLPLHRARCVLQEGLKYFRELEPKFKKQIDELISEWKHIELGFGVLGDIKVVGEC